MIVPRGWIAGALAAVAFAAGLSLGWLLWRPGPPVVEAPAPEERQPDGSLVLERAPDPAARPAMPVPRGSVVERVATVTVVPTGVPRETVAPTAADTNRAPGTAPDSPPQPATDCRCGPVDVHLALVRLPDGSRRVVASATGGRVLGGVDVPVEAARPPRVLRWGAGAAWDPAAGRIGAFLDRDVDRVAFLPIPARVGLSATPDRTGGITYGIRVGLRF